MKDPTVILGIDPGTRVTGFGVLSVEGGREKALDYGCIRPPAKKKLSDRYLIIHDDVSFLIEKYHPDAVVVETQFMKKNFQSAIKLGMARGAVIIAAKKRGVAVYEYAPKQAKRAVCHGFASKEQVQGMIKQLLNLDVIPEPEDAADALALAVCHAQMMRNEHSEVVEI